MKMQEIVLWLRHVEDMASSIYLAAAASGRASGQLKVFLERLAEDEAWHYHLMGSAAELMREQEEAPISSILVDAHARARVETPLLNLHEKIKQKNITEQDILQTIVATETSEWNDIFLYVIHSCMELSPTFQYISATIQAHEKRINKYLTTLPEALKEFLDIMPQQEIWKIKILVVDDEPNILRLWEKVLGKYGHVTTAQNGQIALNMLARDFFDVIVTDIDMPILSGIDLLHKAIRDNPHLREHFILCTGNLTAPVMSAVHEYGVPLLEKPVTIQQISVMVEKILSN